MDSRYYRTVKRRYYAAGIKAERRKQRLECVCGIRPNPVELDAVFLTEDVAESYRYMQCPRYADCLLVACIGYWINFSCRACAIYSNTASALSAVKVIRSVLDE